jgi:multidrug efflux pump subunit AcrA (membrane-fusion protein)
MKILKFLTVILVLCGVLFLSLSCSSSANTTSTTKIATASVKNGNLTVSITGTGNLAYAKTEKLAFEMAGYVQDVLVSAGDTVVEGQELATLDTSDWNDQITSLERKLTSAQRSLANSEWVVGTKQLAVSQTQLDLDTANYNLENISDVKTAQDKIDSIQTNLDIAENMLKVPDEDKSYWLDRIKNLEISLASAQRNKAQIISGNGVNISTDVALQVAQDSLKVEQAKRAVEDAQLAVRNAQLDQSDAELDVQEAQNNLDKVKSESPVVKAPFDGYIIKVNVSGGDEVYKGSVAVEIADPNQFEADILVTESDISSVKLNGEATVSLDALSNVTFPAKITKIAPTATVSSGVVNFNVVVTLTSLVPNKTTQSTSGQMPSPPSGVQLPDSSTMGSGQGFPTQGRASAGGDNSTAASESSTTSSSVTLMDGLSATVQIISAQATNALIIPSKAITTQGPNTTVQVVKGTATETRSVKTGITDGTNTVVTSGLTAGETVSYSVKSSSGTATTATGNNGGLMQGIGGGGGGPPPGGF